jgi:hypothetical protein
MRVPCLREAASWRLLFGTLLSSSLGYDSAGLYFYFC